MSEAPIVDPLDIPRDAVLAMRHLRRLAKNRSYVRECVVDRVDTRTGEVRRRKVRRRKQWLRGQQAGFLAVDNGPAVVADIARILHADRGGQPPTREDFGLVA